MVSRRVYGALDYAGGRLLFPRVCAVDNSTREPCARCGLRICAPTVVVRCNPTPAAPCSHPTCARWGWAELHARGQCAPVCVLCHWGRRAWGDSPGCWCAVRERRVWVCGSGEKARCEERWARAEVPRRVCHDCGGEIEWASTVRWVHLRCGLYCVDEGHDPRFIM